MLKRDNTSAAVPKSEFRSCLQRYPALFGVRVEAVRAADGVVDVERAGAGHGHVEGGKAMPGIPPTGRFHADTSPQVRLVLLLDVVPFGRGS